MLMPLGILQQAESSSCGGATTPYFRISVQLNKPQVSVSESLITVLHIPPSPFFHPIPSGYCTDVQVLFCSGTSAPDFQWLFYICGYVYVIWGKSARIVQLSDSPFMICSRIILSV
jgi:hypothetical protein